MIVNSFPYGLPSAGVGLVTGTAKLVARCVNAEPGEVARECGDPAIWIGYTERGHAACFCERCKIQGWEAKYIVSWQRIGEPMGVFLRHRESGVVT